ncbi:hypothetical protein OG579_11705 [Williamsia herbipolensis]|uniref:Uncharacterized protein n=1 Tax=Williamsia herbipolensis TaxID=1603258 RepID=A0AAU4JXB0_9NOCA|nr:hypothetical protein [Williamsia herbipolensis]
MSARVAGVVSVRGAAVAALIPALAVAAHAIASGSAPGPLGVGAALLVGVVAGIFAGPHCGRLGLLLVLSAGQAVAHLALSMGMSHSGAMSSGMASPPDSPGHHHVMPSGEMMGGAGHAAHGSAGGGSSMLLDHLAVLAHPGSADGLLMLLTHLVAIPLCVVLVALAGAVSGMATVVVAALTTPITALAQSVSTVVTVTLLVIARRIDRAAGAGTRGPPVVGTFA